MTISELIVKLEDLRTMHGDVQVFYWQMDEAGADTAEPKLEYWAAGESGDDADMVVINGD